MPAKKSMKSKKTGGNMRISRPVISPHLRITMPYSQSGAIAEAAANLGAVQTFALNSAFDPDFSGGGLQPLGFDQYAQFYGRYRVVGVRVEVSISNGSSTVPVLSGIYCSPQSTNPAVATAWRVQPVPVNVTKLLSPNSGGTSVAKFTAKVPLASTFGVTPTEFTTDMDFQAIFTASPARLAYMHVWIQGVSGAVASAYWSVRMWQDIELSQPVSLSLS